MLRRGSDKGLTSVSALFTSLYTLLQRKHSRTEADRLVRALSMHKLHVSPPQRGPQQSAVAAVLMFNRDESTKAQNSNALS